jgi:CubicO group peptidase (beta-lactamase class C family)
MTQEDNYMAHVPGMARHLATGIFILITLLAFLTARGILSAQAGAKKSEKPTPGQVKKILGDFAAYAQQAQKDWRVPGMAIAIVQDDKVVFARGFGVKKVGGSDKVDEHTIFQIGSTSKAFTAALVAKLVDEKKFAWQDRVTFAVGADGRAQSLALDWDGGTEFKRMEEKPKSE